MEALKWQKEELKRKGQRKKQPRRNKHLIDLRRKAIVA